MTGEEKLAALRECCDEVLLADGGHLQEGFIRGERPGDLRLEMMGQ